LLGSGQFIALDERAQATYHYPYPTSPPRPGKCDPVKLTVTAHLDIMLMGTIFDMPQDLIALGTHTHSHTFTHDHLMAREVVGTGVARV